MYIRATLMVDIIGCVFVRSLLYVRFIRPFRCLTTHNDMTSELDLNEQSQLVNHLYREISNLAIEPEPLFKRDYQMFGRFEMYLLKYEKVVADKKSVGTPDSKGKHKFYEVLEDMLCGENPNPEYVEAFNIARNKYIFPALEGNKKML